MERGNWMDMEEIAWMDTIAERHARSQWSLNGEWCVASIQKRDDEENGLFSRMRQSRESDKYNTI